MTTHTTHTHTRANAKDLILSRAVDLASIYGLNGLTIGKLADDLSLSKGGICAHFPSKIELQLATVERAAILFNRAVIKPARDHAPGLPRLQALSDAWLQYVETSVFAGGCFFTNAMLELDDLESSEVHEAVKWQYNGYIDIIERYTSEAIAEGHFRADLNTHVFALQFVGIQLSTLLWRGLQHSINPIETVRLAVTDLLSRATV